MVNKKKNVTQEMLNLVVIWTRLRRQRYTLKADLGDLKTRNETSGTNIMSLAHPGFKPANRLLQLKRGLNSAIHSAC